LKKLTPPEIIKIGQELYDSMDNCLLCPMDCAVNRHMGELGNCFTGAQPFVASWDLHFGEEPPLSGGGGSGTIFMAHCNLFCKYCQNYRFSQLDEGYEISIDKLAEAMLELQELEAENINLVTPSHQVAVILLALGKAMEMGLNLPIVYNCSGFEKPEIIRKLAGIIDIYLVDMRYNNNEVAKKYSGCDNYVEQNRASVKEMFQQVGNLEVDNRGIAKSGVIVRHLVLPDDISGSEGIFRFLADEVSPEIFVSLMSQYHPAYKACNDPTLNRRITRDEFAKAKEAFFRAGLENGFIQEI